MKQVSRQSINEFLSQMQGIWDQLALSEPSWENAKDAEKFFKYCDNLRVMQFLMALNHKYEPIRGSILHRGSLPTIEGAMSELLSEEVRLNILKLPSNTIDTNHVLTVPSKAPILTSYLRSSVTTVAVKVMSFQNAGPRKTRIKIVVILFSRANNITDHLKLQGAVVDDSSPTFSLNDLESVLKQLARNSIASTSHIVSNATTSSALSTTPSTSNSCLFNSGCCNHMTCESAMFTANVSPMKIAPIVHTAHNSKFYINC